MTRPAAVMPHVPPGFQAAVFATDLDQPWTLRTAPNGDIFVAESGAGRIRILPPGDGDARPGPAATFAADGALWCVVNERDGLGDNLPPDYASQVRPGAFYGWPWFYIGAHPDPRMSGARMDLENRVSVPDVLIQPHSAPLGLAFYQRTQVPLAYRGDAFVALHGSWNRAQRTGYKVVRLRFQDGRPTGVYQDFLTGFVLSDQAVWGRPVGLTVMQDGALQVSEDANGTIWRITCRPDQ